MALSRTVYMMMMRRNAHCLAGKNTKVVVVGGFLLLFYLSFYFLFPHITNSNAFLGSNALRRVPDLLLPMGCLLGAVDVMCWYITKESGVGPSFHLIWRKQTHTWRGVYDYAK